MITNHHIFEKVPISNDEQISHSDVKPANIILDFSSKVKLMNFSLAGTKNDKRIHAGTPKYAAPEQLRGTDAALRPQSTVTIL